MTIRGDAGFKYTPATATSETTFTMEFPLRNISGGRAQTRYVHWAADNTARNVVALGTTTVDEVTADIRGENDVSGLKTMFKNGLNDVTLTYFPSLTATGTSYPVKLVSVDGRTNTRLSPDADRWYNGRYQANIRIRRTDGGSLDGLMTVT